LMVRRRMTEGILWIEGLQPASGVSRDILRSRLQAA